MTLVQHIEQDFLDRADRRGLMGIVTDHDPIRSDTPVYKTTFNNVIGTLVIGSSSPVLRALKVYGQFIGEWTKPALTMNSETVNVSLKTSYLRLVIMFIEEEVNKWKKENLAEYQHVTNGRPGTWNQLFPLFKVVYFKPKSPSK